MGCDIHLYVEKRNANGKWISADTWTPDEWAAKEAPNKLEVVYDNRFYSDRNYDLFAILADVRNGLGFAGIDTGDGFVPIADPRGLPFDVTPAVRAESDAWGCDGHSHSYFTVAELKAYNWNRTTKHRGVVDPWNFELWRRNGKPNSWSGDVSGNLVTKITNNEMAGMIDTADLQWEGDEQDKDSWFGRRYSTLDTRAARTAVGAAVNDRGVAVDPATGKALPEPSYFTTVEWEESYAESCKNFLNTTIPKLEKIGHPDSVRIVFWFDN